MKIIFAVLLLLCWLKMPYGYYQIIRFGGLILFSFYCYQEIVNGNTFKAIVYGCLAVLFQPFEKMYLGRSLWNIVDTLVAIFLIIDSINNKSK